jgi:hypothetical protein
MVGDCTDCPVETFGLGDEGLPLVIPSVLAPGLAVFLVSNRLYWRFRMLGRFGLDDLATMLATVRLEYSTRKNDRSDCSNRHFLLSNVPRPSQRSTLVMADLLIHWNLTKLLKH